MTEVRVNVFGLYFLSYFHWHPSDIKSDTIEPIFISNNPKLLLDTN